MKKRWIRDDKFGNRYLSFGSLLNLADDHPLWHTIRREARRKPVLEDLTTRAECLAAVAEGVCGGWQFSPGLTRVIGFFAVDVHPLPPRIATNDTLILMRTNAYGLWPSPIDNCTTSQQHDRLMRFLLDEVWAHHVVYSDYGISLPDELFSTERPPCWDTLAQWTKRRLCHAVVWLPSHQYELQMCYTYDHRSKRYHSQLLDG